MRKKRESTEQKAASTPQTHYRISEAVHTQSVVLPSLITIAEAASAARVSRPTIVRAYRAGDLRTFRTPGGGRVHVYADSLAEWIARNTFGGSK